MGLFNGRKFNSTHIALRGNRSLSQEMVSGLVNKTIEVLGSYNCRIDPSTEKKSDGWLEYKLIGGGNVTFIIQIENRLDITVDSKLSKAEFETVVSEIDQYPASLGLVPMRDYSGLNH